MTSPSPANAPNDSTDPNLSDELAEMFDRCVIGYFVSVDAEQWSAAFEYRRLIDYIHNLAEQVAA